MRMSITRAKELRKNSTDAERALWRVLRSRQLSGHKFRRQQPLGPFVVDFVCLEARLVVEIDGGQHGEDRQLAYDSRRTVWLQNQNFRVLRFWNHEVLNQLDSVSELIEKALAMRHSGPNLSSSPLTGED
jgi:adenine-specific DNA-methyltransferase